MVRMLSVRNKSGVIQKGELFDLPRSCTDKMYHNKCAAFYEKVFAEFESGFHICPFGHVIYYSKNHNLAYIGLKVNGVSRKGKNAGEGIYLPSISKERILRVIEHEIEMLVTEEECNNIRRLKDELLHGMEKILVTCRAKSESLLAALDHDDSEMQLSTLREDLKTILMGNIQLRNLFYATRMRYDSSLPNKRYSTAVYSKFFKAKKLLHKYMGRDVPIVFEGESYSEYDLTASFEILPYLLLENASKFSLVGGRVEVKFVEEEKQLEIIVSNTGPYTSKPQNVLCKDRERGEHSAEAGVGGSGIGLFTCQEIATLNHLGFTVKSDAAKIANVNGIPYAPFIVDIIFPASLYSAE